jgi:hypothetical protein
MRFPRRSAAAAPRPYTYECAGCGATHHSLDNRIPVGWSTLHTRVLCADCTTCATHRARRTKPVSRP